MRLTFVIFVIIEQSKTSFLHLENLYFGKQNPTNKKIFYANKRWKNKLVYKKKRNSCSYTYEYEKKIQLKQCTGRLRISLPNEVNYSAKGKILPDIRRCTGFSEIVE